MKLFLNIISIFILSTSAFSQDDEARNGEKIRERMSEYIQKKLSLTSSEADKFAPVFVSYINDLRQTNKTYKGDRLVLQQKIVDLRLRYREQLKGIMGEKRSNDFFKYEHEFVNEVKELRKERMQNRGDRSVDRKKREPLL